MLRMWATTVSSARLNSTRRSALVENRAQGRRGLPTQLACADGSQDRMQLRLCRQRAYCRRPAVWEVDVESFPAVLELSSDGYRNLDHARNKSLGFWMDVAADATLTLVNGLVVSLQILQARAAFGGR